ncbi:MAG: ABC transporter substrate-binding protein [Oscillospiraceae bacterium]|nr:ABC transporter substrate-binding protein [Oscillospiraceae bacterium]
MKIKRIIAAVTAAAMLSVGVTGCSGDSGKLKIGISKMMTHDAMDRAEEGFKKALLDKGYDDTKVEIDAQNGQGETANLNTIATQFVGDDVDLIFAIATPAAQAAQGQTTEIPIIGTAITDFQVAGLVNSNDAPGTNVSGTTDMNPVEEQIDLMMKLAPDTKVVGFLYNSSEDNSVLQTDIAKKYVESLGLTWTEKTVSNTNEVQQATTSIVNECDAIYIPTDNIFASSMTTVYEVCVEAKKPVICGESGMTMAGGLATLGLDYYNLGYQAGLMAVRVLEGEDISKMPIEGASEFVYCINGDFAEAIGMTVPEDLQQYVQKPAAAE